MDGDIYPCANCGKRTHIDKLDAKPKSLASQPATWHALYLAADAGEDFDVLECSDCYGPSYKEAP